jgi:hypothetical protein
MDDGLSPPPIYIAPPDPLVPQSSPMGDPARRPPLDACMVHRSDEINAAEQALECALIVVVGGARPPVSTADVRLWLKDLYGILSSNVTSHRFHPEDFLISFSSPDDMFRVLHHPPPNPLFALILKRWRRQLMASVGNLLFCVTIALHGLWVTYYFVSPLPCMASPPPACLATLHSPPTGFSYLC